MNAQIVLRFHSIYCSLIGRLVPVRYNVSAIWLVAILFLSKVHSGEVGQWYTKTNDRENSDRPVA